MGTVAEKKCREGYGKPVSHAGRMETRRAVKIANVMRPSAGFPSGPMPIAYHSLESSNENSNAVPQ